MLAGYTLEQLNKIPEGYNNNLIWNIAHVVVVQQMLVYKLSEFYDDLTKWLRNIKGSKPEHIATQAEVDELKLLLGNHQSNGNRFRK
jgi:hypothetical protein